MSKYIDLYEAMDEDIVLTGRERQALVDALRWLDSHPDQAPGRTITESRYRAFTDSASEEYQAGFSDGFFFADGCVISDPEPTNAEKLEGILHVAMQEDGWGDEDEANILAAALEAAGVKAPGGE